MGSYASEEQIQVANENLHKGLAYQTVQDDKRSLSQEIKEQLSDQKEKVKVEKEELPNVKEEAKQTKKQYQKEM